MSLADELDVFTTPGRDRDGAHAMLSQARLGHHPIDEVQVAHLVRIGWCAGQSSVRRRAEADVRDAHKRGWLMLCVGVVAGVLLALLALGGWWVW